MRAYSSAFREGDSEGQRKILVHASSGGVSKEPVLGAILRGSSKFCLGGGGGGWRGVGGAFGGGW